MIEVLPVFTVPPDWASPVRESLEWKTNVMASQVGAEQRIGTRLNPRRRQEVPFTSIRREHAYLEQLLSVEPQGRYYVPVWFERGLTDTPTTAGATGATIASLGREFLDAQFIIFLGPKPHQYEIAEINVSGVSAGHTVFAFLAPVAQNWPVGTLVCPCRSAVIEANNTVSFTRAGARALQGSVRFLFDEPYAWVSALTPPTYLAQPVFELPCNESDNQGGTFERLYGTYDGGNGRTLQIDLGGKAFPTFSSTNWIQGRTANEALRDLLFYLRGRQVHGWWVHPVDDFIPAAGILTGDTTITVERAGVADFGLTSSRTHIRVLLRDGTTYYRQLTGASNIDDDTESIHMNAAIGATIPLEEIANIRYMSQGRLDQDLVSLDHVTDQEGITQYTLGIRMVPEIRTSTDWDPPALFDPNMHPDTCLVIDGTHLLGAPPGPVF